MIEYLFEMELNDGDFITEVFYDKEESIAQLNTAKSNSECVWCKLAYMKYKNGVVVDGVMIEEVIR